MTYNPITGVYTPATGATNAFSGKVIASATWNSIFNDLATALTTLGQAGSIVPVATYTATVKNVSFTLINTDNSIPVVVPPNTTNYRLINAMIANPTQTLASSFCTLWTGAGATGVQIVTSTAITITSTVSNTNNNLMGLPVTNQSTTSYSLPTLFFRVGVAAGAAGAQADVVLYIQPLP